MRGRAPVLGLAALGLAAVALGACGRKGPPVAPERRVPQPVADLRALVREDAIELGWVNPRRRRDGTRLRDLVLARVFRHVAADAGEPRPALLDGDRIAGYTEVATIRLAAPAPPAVVEGDRVRWSDRRDLVRDRRYTYVVLTADALGRLSPPSERVSVVYLAVPEAPAGLAAEPGEGEARLAWQPPARLVDGSDAPAGLRYEVLRAPAPEAPLGLVTAVSEPRFVDRGLVNDQIYHYAVRAVRVEGATRALGRLSARAAVTPRDVTPPAAPSGLVAIPAEGQVRLAWRPSPDADVVGYVVYRAAPGGAFARVGSARAPAVTFTDRDVPRGDWRYAVTAVDAAALANESPRSNEVRVTVP